MEKALSLEIDDFSKKNNGIKSDNFSSGGCEWFVKVYPKGYRCSDHLSLFLHVVNPESLRRGWKRRAIYCFVLSNQSGQVLYRSPNESKCDLFCAEVPNWGCQKTLPLTELGFLEKNKLTVEVYIKVVEVVHQGKSTENDIIDFNGFQIIASQAFSVANIVSQDPYFVVDFRPENQWVQTKYMSLLGLVETLSKSPQSLSATELSNAQRDLTALTEAGFKLDWLNSKLEEVSLEWKKASHSDGSSVQQLKEQVKNVELSLSDLIVELENVKIKSAAAAKVSSFQFIDFLIKKFFLSCFSFSKS
ncbi:MATH domain and coiled-coil domain-containing protein At2g42465 [Brassica rapa]|uniref:MATH domain-containing protein n=1 Tax=Brassica campestris TaxID=3711 RepID=M4DFI2_BRACM|nr:MATH domain and coiled-coil domain-containing protein At2g42465 [Brassica rapa]